MLYGLIFSDGFEANDEISRSKSYIEIEVQERRARARREVMVCK